MAQVRTVLVLATGANDRMASALPKVLHPLLGRSLLGHVLAACDGLAAERTEVVAGDDRAGQIAAHLAEVGSRVRVCRAGAGESVRDAVASAAASEGTVVVVPGDLPLLRAETLAAFVEAHEAGGAAATLLTARVTDLPGTDRVLYAFDPRYLGLALVQLEPGEVSVTDLVAVLRAEGSVVGACPVADPSELLGCDDRVDLAGLGSRLRERVNVDWMRAGVTIVDPLATWIDVTAVLGRDTVVEPGTHVCGRSSVGAGAVLGPDTSLVDAVVGDGARVVRAHVVGATIGPRASVGPYAYLRPGTVLREAAKVGAFVEVKNSDVGAGTKIPHLSYVGDATIGEETNIGAANVVVNYDGVSKHRTVVGSHVRTGSDTMLVAPVTVGDGAYTAAGSVVTRDVPPGALAVARAHQRNIEGWVVRRRPGSRSAEAATRAADETRAALPQAASADGTPTGDTASD